MEFMDPYISTTSVYRILMNKQIGRNPCLISMKFAVRRPEYLPYKAWQFDQDRLSIN